MLNAATHGLWETTAPPAPETQAMSGNVTCDVVILGAGYTGLSTALHLAQRGIRVVVLEKNDIGFGGAGRNVGLVNAGMWVMPDELPKVLGDVHGERLLTLLGNAPSTVFDLVRAHEIDCQLETSGTLHCGVGKAGLDELKAREAQWLKRGANVCLLSPEETAQTVGSHAYAGALLDLRAGTIQPLAYARGLAAAAIKAGAQIFTRTPASGVGFKPDGGYSAVTPKGRVFADWVVLAMDAYCEGPFRMIGREQVRLPYFNFATEPLPADIRATILPDRQGAWDTREVLSSFRMDRFGRLVFGSVGALHGTGAAIHRAWALRALHRIFPQVGKVRFEAAWYGQIGMTDDNLPRLHKWHDRIVSVSGYNGRGIAPGTVMGREIAALIAGDMAEDDLPLPVTVPREVKARAAKEMFYEIGAQAVHLIDSRF